MYVVAGEETGRGAAQREAQPGGTASCAEGFCREIRAETEKFGARGKE